MPLCPVCAGESRPTATYGAELIRLLLADEFGEKPPAHLTLPDYEMHECERCTLVFADPMRPGDVLFYEWVAGFPSYHAESRWEWSAVHRVLEQKKSVQLLELGCGEGKFLASLADLKHVDAMGIDLSDASVARARALGLNARRAAINDILGGSERFDMIVMTHVLEHVERPLAVIESCKRLLHNGGEIMFSVPYSPTSREYVRLDVMNLPPHHLTRWNMASLRCLADVSKLKFSYGMRKPKPLLKRAIRHTLDAANAKDTKGHLRRLAVVLSNPRLFTEAIRLHRTREKIEGRRAADEIVVRLRS
jgi:2-polyprenyl-3-methyl-5-hydroxy-6-metoxy-1,4-benzoquinol methylase